MCRSARFSENGVSGSFDIDGFGEVTGSQADGCTVTGVVSILDTDYNLYAVDLDASACGVYNGSYDGLATLDNDMLMYVVTSDSYIIINSLTRE